MGVLAVAALHLWISQILARGWEQEEADCPPQLPACLAAHPWCSDSLAGSSAAASCAFWTL